MKRAHIGISAQFYVCGNKKRCRFCDAEDNYLKEQFEQDPSLTKIKPYYRDKTWSINMSTDGQKAHLYKYHQNEIKLLLADHYNMKLGGAVSNNELSNILNAKVTNPTERDLSSFLFLLFFGSCNDF